MSVYRDAEQLRSTLYLVVILDIEVLFIVKLILKSNKGDILKEHVSLFYYNSSLCSFP